MKGFINKNYKEKDFKVRSFKRLIIVLFLLPITAQAFDFYWEGNYSAEGNYLNKVDLGNSTDGTKAYINHHLLLRPEIILFEGLSVHGALDTINGVNSIPPSSRVGHTLGGGLSSNKSTYSSDVSQPFLQRQIQKPRGVDINEAYLKYSHTNGELRLGRQPLEFGYGAFYSAGYNTFDHWLTNRDGVSYDFTLGPLRFTPMLNFMTSAIRTGSQTTEFGLKFNFRVKDTGLDLGFMYLQRHVPSVQNTLNPVQGVSGAATPKMYSIFYNKQKKNIRYGFEALLQGGKVGSGVSLNGFGFAGEIELNMNNWKLLGKFGYAQGDNPNNTSSFSSVAMHRNYNLGMILFNHPLGESNLDLLGTNNRGKRAGLLPTDYSPDLVVDTESISNALYLAPTASYLLSNKWSLGSTLVMAWLNETQILGVGKVSAFLGSEVDFTLIHNPTQNITYKTTLGFFMPGGAFRGAGSLKTNTSFGVITSLGVRF